MGTLAFRLKRLIRETLAQFIALAVVIALGISLYIGFNTTLISLKNSQEIFYTENNFADHYFYVSQAPEAIIKQIEAIDGVTRATGRIQQDVTLIKENGERATLRLTSYPLPLSSNVNKITLKEGRYFEQYAAGGGFEAMVDPGFYAANKLRPGSTVNIVAQNHQYPIRITGCAAGPEFAYPIKDAFTMLTDFKTFGIMMIPHTQAQTILNLPGQMNQIIVQFKPGTDEKQAVASIKNILKPYGDLADYARQDQSSHAILQAKIDGIANIAGFLPTLFLCIAAAVQFILIRRMVKTQRGTIGILKALGYNNWQVMLHYSSYTLVVGILGALLGIFMGSGLAGFLLRLYAQYFNLPISTSGINLQVIILSILLAVGVSWLAGLTAARSIVTINPAASMRSAAPIKASHSLLESWTWLWSRLDNSWKMAVRNLRRNRLRVVVLLIGVISAVALLVISLVMKDSVDYLMNHHFSKEISYDYMLRFEKPVSDSELLAISRIDGVHKLEGFLAVPVKIHFQGKSNVDLLQGQSLNSNLKLPVSANNDFSRIPEKGIIISKKTADKLGIEVGDSITLETELPGSPIYTTSMRVTGINYQLIGNESFASIKEVNRILHQSALVSGAMLLVDKNQSKSFEKAMADIPGIISVQSRQYERDNINTMMGTLTSTVGTMVFFAILLGFIIIFNTVLLSFNERRRELASLLTIGFSHQEISRLLFKETLLQAAVAILIGLPVGQAMAEMYFHSIEFEMWTIPVVTQPSSFFWAALGAATFVLAGQWFATRGIKNLNTVELLKNAD